LAGAERASLSSAGRRNRCVIPDALISTDELSGRLPELGLRIYDWLT
jgi:hypothetical protein